MDAFGSNEHAIFDIVLKLAIEDASVLIDWNSSSASCAAYSNSDNLCVIGL